MKITYSIRIIFLNKSLLKFSMQFDFSTYLIYQKTLITQFTSLLGYTSYKDVYKLTM